MALVVGRRWVDSWGTVADCTGFWATFAAFSATDFRTGIDVSNPDAELRFHASSYYNIVIWGAPAILGTRHRNVADRDAKYLVS